MPEFKRARNEEQKLKRMQEIKNAVEELFKELPYHEITFTAIADKLSMTRAHLYQYISTKEEIFLEICADKRDLYYDALRTAIPPHCGYSAAVIAEVWAGILNVHREHLLYCDILSTIIETNVSVDRLAAFKKRYYEQAYDVCEQICSPLELSKEDSYQIFLNVHYHAVGLYTICHRNPLVIEALQKAQIPVSDIDFRMNMKEFIVMNLDYYVK